MFINEVIILSSILPKVIVATICGALVGIEREKRNKVADNLKWEVDVFSQKCHIIIAEVEIPNEEYDLDIPDFIQKKSLLEVTGMKQFSNRSLSNRVK